VLSLDVNLKPFKQDITDIRYTGTNVHISLKKYYTLNKVSSKIITSSVYLKLNKQNCLISQIEADVSLIR
jgi:hypothetical protein